MEFNLDPQSLIKILAEVTRCEVTEKEGLYQLALRSRYAKDTKFDINSVEIEQLIEGIKAKDVYDETTLYDDVSCEVFVKEESSVRFRRFREERLEVKDSSSHMDEVQSSGNWELGIGKKREMYLTDTRIAIVQIYCFCE